MNKFKLISLLLLMLLVFISFVNADDIDKQEEILEEIQTELKALDDASRNYDNQKNKVIKNIKILEESVRGLENEIVVLEDSIEDNKVQIVVAGDELEAAKQILFETNELLEDRIRVMYKNGTVGYFEVMLDSRSFEDLLSRIEMLKKIVTSDTELIEQLELDKIAVDEKKAALEEEQIKLMNLQEEKIVKQNDLKEKITEYESRKAEIQKDIRAVEIQIDATNADAEKVKNIIKDMKLMEQFVGGKMTWPIPGKWTVSSNFGMRLHPILKVNKLHTGVDIRTPEGTPIVAALDGKVIWSNWLGGYGKAVMIDHGGGMVTLYAHNSKLLVKKGQTVQKGQNISLSGNTGNSTGPHLHFEVRKEGEFIDPMDGWIKVSN